MLQRVVACAARGRVTIVGLSAGRSPWPGGGWDPTVSRWTKTAFLKPGKNTVVGTIHDSNNYSINEKNGKVVRFEIFMYNPLDGETLYVDNIRLSTAKEEPAKLITKFPVLGTDLEVTGVRELGKLLNERWTKPENKTLEQLERDFRTLFDNLKMKLPRRSWPFCATATRATTRRNWTNCMPAGRTRTGPATARTA